MTMYELNHEPGWDTYKPGLVDLTDMPEYAYMTGFKSVTPNSAAANQSAASELPDVERLYRENEERAIEAAEKQMQFQQESARAGMEFNAREADKNRAWLAEMSNTAYQRAVADLRKAGLNPALAYSQGGASVPGSSAATGFAMTGSKADFDDTGYTSYQLKYAYTALIVNSAVDLAKSLLKLL